MPARSTTFASAPPRWKRVLSTMRLRIACPESNAYEGEAAFVALPSSDGEMGVLPGHANEICTVEAGVVRVCDKALGTVDRRFAVAGGYAEITGDEVVILAQRAKDLSSVDAEAVRARLQDFEDQLSNLSQDDARRAYLYNEISWLKLLLAA